MEVVMKNRNIYGYFFIAPFFIVLAIFAIYPVFLTLFYTFTDFKGFGDYKMIGFDNWVRFVGDVQFRDAFVNTWKIWGLNIVVQLGLAFILVFLFSDMSWKIKDLVFLELFFTYLI
jgi:ABC-type sugar transport system permease subunit